MYGKFLSQKHILKSFVIIKLSIFLQILICGLKDQGVHRLSEESLKEFFYNSFVVCKYFLKFGRICKQFCASSVVLATLNSARCLCQMPKCKFSPESNQTHFFLNASVDQTLIN